MERLDPTRWQISSGVSRAELETIVEDKRVKTLQFCQPLSKAEIESLERIVFSRRPDITLRVFGFYGLTCDLSFLEKIPSVQRLSADCLLRAVGVDALTGLSNLKELSIGIFNLESFDFLYLLPTTITELALFATFSKKPSIEAIGHFKDLKYLYLEGQQKGIDAVNELPNLEKIVLRSISTRDVSYLRSLEKLWSVDVKLGGIKDFEALTDMSLKYLELWQVRGLSDLSFVSEIPSLQNLFIQSLRHVTRLPKFKNSLNLRRLYLENLKNLKDVSSVEFAPSLREFVYVLAMNQKPEDLLPVLRNNSLRSVCCRFGSQRKNDEFDRLAESYGKQQYSYSEFKYE
jgi:hypothetical protein